MALINIHLDEAVEKIDKDIVPDLEPILTRVVASAVDKLKDALVGRTITVTIKID